MTELERQELEQIQRARLVEVNSQPGPREALEAAHGQVWDAEQLRQDFEVLQFAAPWVVVRRRQDGQVGSLEFQHHPRLYYGWRPDQGQD